MLISHFLVHFITLSSGVPADCPPDQTISEELSVFTLKEGIYVFQSQPWNANSLLVVDETSRTSVLVDTPALPRTTRAMLNWIVENLNVQVSAAVNSNWHPDASGGNQVLREQGVPIYASISTHKRLQKDGAILKAHLIKLNQDKPLLQKGFRELNITLPTHPISGLTHHTITQHGTEFQLIHSGATHTVDHIMVYFPKHKVMYGGCAVRGGETLGALEEATDIKNWRRAIQKLKLYDSDYVIPGYGSNYHPSNLNNTIQLLELHTAKSR